MKKNILFSILCVLLFSCKNSTQEISKENVIDILLAKFSNVNNISYTSRFVYTETTDTTITHEYYEKYKDSSGYLLSFHYTAFRFDKLFFQEVFNAGENKLYYQSAEKTSIIDFNNPPKYMPGIEQISTSLITLVQYLKQTKTKFPKRVMIKDTIINSKELYLIEFSNPDGIPIEDRLANLLNDTIYHLGLIVDKSTSLPEYTKYGNWIGKISNIILNSNEHEKIWNKVNIPQNFLERVTPYTEDSKNVILQVGTKIPNWEFKTIEGNDFEILKFKKKQLIVLFSTNCGGCIAEIPALNCISETKNTTVLAVYFGNKISELKNFINKYKIKYQIVINNDSTLSSQIVGFPVNYLIDENGKIIYSELGYNPDLEGKIKQGF